MTRISQLPARDWQDRAEYHADELTRLLRQPNGGQTLWPSQGQTLAELHSEGGAFCGVRAGGGKTAIMALAPSILQARRPLLLGPAASVKKTYRDFAELREHWQMTRGLYRVESYSKVSQSTTCKACDGEGCPDCDDKGEFPDVLENYQPDLLVLNEAHLVKNVRGAACARRVSRYISRHPDMPVIVLSGTLRRNSLLDFAHLLVWALGDGAPVPHRREDQERWAACLDDHDDSQLAFLSRDLGPLRSVEHARQVFKERLQATPGVIISQDWYGDTPLHLTAKELVPPPELDEPFRRLRELWVTPDGWELADAAFECYAVARQLAQGFFYRPDPRPPEPWSEARKAWCRLSRRTLEAEGQELYDSESQVAAAARAGRLGPEGKAIWETWDAIRPTFTLNPKPEWLSDHALLAAEAWGREGRGIIWTEHRAFALELARRTGWPYYGQLGRDALTGRCIEDDRGDHPIIASLIANAADLNLQGPGQFHRNLYTSVVGDANLWEQSMARTHRFGQTAQSVEVYYWIGCYEHRSAMTKAFSEARANENQYGPPQKLSYALHTPLLDANINEPEHNAWARTQGNRE